MSTPKQARPRAVAAVNVLGIDPSLCHTGLCLIGPELRGAHAVTRALACSVESAPLGESIAARCERIGRILAQVASVVDDYRPALVALENYSFGSNQAQQSRLVELGAVLRWELAAQGLPTVEVAPTQLKKFAGGGGSKKDELRLLVYKRWGFEAKSTDEVDAFVLAKIGQAIVDPAAAGELTVPQRQVVEAVSGQLASNAKDG